MSLGAQIEAQEINDELIKHLCMSAESVLASSAFQPEVTAIASLLVWFPSLRSSVGARLLNLKYSRDRWFIFPVFEYFIARFSRFASSNAFSTDSPGSTLLYWRQSLALEKASALASLLSSISLLCGGWQTPLRVADTTLPPPAIDYENLDRQLAWSTLTVYLSIHIRAFARLLFHCLTLPNYETSVYASLPLFPARLLLPLNISYLRMFVLYVSRLPHPVLYTRIAKCIFRVLRIAVMYTATIVYSMLLA